MTNKRAVRFLTRWFVCSLGLWIAAALLGDDRISLQDRFGVVIISGLVLALVNTLVRPILVFFSLPAVLLSLGIFMIVINALTVLLAARLYGPLQVSGFSSAILVGVIIGLVNFLVSAIVEEKHA